MMMTGQSAVPPGAIPRMPMTHPDPRIPPQVRRISDYISQMLIFMCFLGFSSRDEATAYGVRLASARNA